MNNLPTGTYAWNENGNQSFSLSGQRVMVSLECRPSSLSR